MEGQGEGFSLSVSANSNQYAFGKLSATSPYRACLKMAMVTAARLLYSTFVARSLQAHEGYARRLRLG